MYPISIALKAKIALDGSETEKRVGAVLFDETVQVLSSFELNQIASLTYSDGTCDQIFELLGLVMSSPMDVTVLSLEKSVVVTTHALIYGSEKCVSSALALSRWVNRLCEFNTVLLAQSQNGVSSWWNSVKGGAVDRGFPVREVAQKLQLLLNDTEKIRQVRADKADPNSLVPVGDDRVAYVSDEVRLFMLKKRIQEQQLIITKSNLAKAQGGYGGGYQTKDGQTVVGAAHSLDEMIAYADREKKKYSDDGPIYVRPEITTANTWQQPTPTIAPIPSATTDLLDMGAPAPVSEPFMNLIDFETIAITSPAPAVMDFFAASPPQQPSTAPLIDPFGAVLAAQVAQPKVNETQDLLSIMTINSVTSTPSLPPSIFDLTGQPSIINNSIQAMPSSTPVPTISGLFPPKPPVAHVMTSNEDRFMALDMLSGPETTNSGSLLSGLEAQNRILGFGSSPKGNEAMTSSFGSQLGSATTVLASTMSGIFGGGPQGLTVPKSGNDVSTMMELGPSSCSLPPDPQTGTPHTIHTSLTGNSHFMGDMAMSSYGMGMTMGGDSYLTNKTDYSSPGAMGMPPPLPMESPPFPTGGIPGITERYGPPETDNDDSGFGIAMGGTIGSGLGEPVGPPPGAPPPPPPTL